MKLNIFLILLFTLFASTLFAQNIAFIDSIIKANVAQYQIAGLTVEFEENGILQNKREIKKFDVNGNTIDYTIINNKHIERQQFAYDSLGRQTLKVMYEIGDTAKVTFTWKSVYFDSISTKMDTIFTYDEFRGKNNIPYSEVRLSKHRFDKDTHWVEEIKKRYGDSVGEKTISRYTRFGDTLLISEFLKYDSKGKMDRIKAYYDLYKKDTKGNLTITDGSCYISLDTWDDISPSDYNLNKEEYIQKQWDGEFEYVYEEHNDQLKVYNSKGQLIQEGYGIFDKKTFEYNSSNKLIKTTYWGSIEDDHGIVETAIENYEYDERGLVIKIQKNNLHNAEVGTQFYEYE